jgi:hypothetical protein
MTEAAKALSSGAQDSLPSRWIALFLVGYRTIRPSRQEIKH